MKKLAFTSLLVFICLSAVHAATPKENMRKVIDKAITTSVKQSMLMYDVLKDMPGKFPKSVANGKFETSGEQWWTSGFYPGTLWYLFEYTNDSTVLAAAEEMTGRVDKVQYKAPNHDVGFQVNCSHGNGYRLTGKEKYRQTMINAGKALADRFSPEVGCTRSWSGKNFTVIIDNMMNLELLTISSALTGDLTHYNMAKSHADKTLKCHFRPDHSCYHVVEYDNETGEIVKRRTQQGAADESAWSRGQAWALYGYTMMYRQTGAQRYLEHAVNVARYLINHPRMPKDMVPYWDFDYEKIPNTPRDASAAAVMASAFVELSQYTEGELSDSLLRTAETQIKSLASPAYSAKVGKNHNFILMHSTGFYLNNKEVDAPLTYADYYFVEALVRYRRLLDGKPVVDLWTTPSENADRTLWIGTLERVAGPVLENLSNNTLRKKMPVESILKNPESRKSVTYLEAFGRVLTGIAPWLELGPDNTPEGRLREKYIDMTLAGLRNCVDPASPDVMNFNKGSQPLVDAAFLAHGLLRARTQVWGRLDKTTQDRLVEALKSTRVIRPNENNWLLFSAMIECALKEFTGEWDFGPVKYALNRHATWYKGDGWYGDGSKFHMDYYNSFVIQPMLMEVLDIAAKNTDEFKEFQKLQTARYTRYAEILERMISPEATFPAIGRSLPYRFGAFQALSDAAFRHILPKGVTPGQVRNALTAVIRRQGNAPGTYDENGWMTVGFCGHQLNIGEYYISTGSLYLCTAAFIALGLDAEDEFWSAPAEDWTQKKVWNGEDVKSDHALRN